MTVTRSREPGAVTPAREVFFTQAVKTAREVFFTDTDTDTGMAPDPEILFYRKFVVRSLRREVLERHQEIFG